MVLQSHDMTEMTSMAMRLVRIPPRRDEGTTSNGCYQDKTKMIQLSKNDRFRASLERQGGRRAGVSQVPTKDPEKTPVTVPKPTQQGSDGWGLRGLLDLSAPLATHYTLLFLPTDMDWLHLWPVRCHVPFHHDPVMYHGAKRLPPWVTLGDRAASKNNVASAVAV
ncbi:uncharacterized protein BKA55DRAFT_533826 [Fusarium redolens]|uniref:Uncharacterized protein n=1 Tax=Fusarium redolens TaxID=48865 RepID=A0A9P9R547_FUSRE|nr:uncharacterized protein BKA55DRAFT_533826 [Fusarium redolens]KAH7267037.1 hypothetical protein BKA55DRAFT_533826 [Fusarium redolens]